MPVPLAIAGAGAAPKIAKFLGKSLVGGIAKGVGGIFKGIFGGGRKKRTKEQARAGREGFERLIAGKTGLNLSFNELVALGKKVQSGEIRAGDQIGRVTVTQENLDKARNVTTATRLQRGIKRNLTSGIRIPLGSAGVFGGSSGRAPSPPVLRARAGATIKRAPSKAGTGDSIGQRVNGFINKFLGRASGRFGGGGDPRAEDPDPVRRTKLPLAVWIGIIAFVIFIAFPTAIMKSLGLWKRPPAKKKPGTKKPGNPGTGKAGKRQKNGWKKNADGTWQTPNNKTVSAAQKRSIFANLRKRKK